jgi:hypothetical protein
LNSTVDKEAGIDASPNFCPADNPTPSILGGSGGTGSKSKTLLWMSQIPEISEASREQE